MKKIVVTILLVVVGLLIFVSFGVSQKPELPDNWIMLGEDAALVIDEHEGSIAYCHLVARVGEQWMQVDLQPTQGIRLLDQQ